MSFINPSKETETSITSMKLTRNSLALMDTWDVSAEPFPEMFHLLCDQQHKYKMTPPHKYIIITIILTVDGWNIAPARMYETL